MNGYVLGKKNSEVYQFYGTKYSEFLVKILSKLDVYQEKFEEKVGTKEFQLFIKGPQFSSLIHFYFHKNEDINTSIILEQFHYFLEGKTGLISDQLGDKILGTNILFSDMDVNPFVQSNSHPDHVDGMIGSLGEKTKNKWLDVFSKTFDILKNVDRSFFDELNQNIHKIIPHGTSVGVHNSGTYSNCIGQLYIGYTINNPNVEIQILEAIIHESSHNKLNLIMHSDSVIECTGEEKYYSAIRPDARPIRGVLLGYHAFVPTMYIMMKAYLGGHIKNKEEWLDKLTLYYLKTKFLQRVIKKHAKFTQVGKEIDEELDYVISLSDVLFKKISPEKKYVEKAKNDQRKHFTDVNLKYPGLMY